jgi:hypothetical protein
MSILDRSLKPPMVPEVHRFRLTVALRLGLDARECVLAMEVIASELPGVPITVFDDGEELLLTVIPGEKNPLSGGIMNLMMLAAGQGRVIEFRIGGDSQQGALLHDKLLAVSDSDASPVFLEAPFEEKDEPFETILLSKPRKTEAEEKERLAEEARQQEYPTAMA